VNLILAEPGEVSAEGLLVLRDRRHAHLRDVLAAEVGDCLRVGEVNGRLGTGELRSLDEREARLQVRLPDAPPPPLPVILVLALPRPKMLRRILRTIAEVGIKDLHLIHSYRVEKSYWQSPLLAPESIGRCLRDGLEQAGDTVLPTVTCHRRFRPFAEDVLPGLCQGREARLAHPGAARGYPAEPAEPSLLLIGPEGGFIPFEVERLCAAGAEARHLGQRILRVETALQAILGRHLGAPNPLARLRP